MDRGANPRRTARAWSLRREATRAEARLWWSLRGRGLLGAKFVRQEPIGPWFADFACREARLVVEVDGATHSTPAELARDAARSTDLEHRGWRVLRVTNTDVHESREAVLDTIAHALTAGGWQAP